MARGWGGLAETEVAGRPPLPRHKCLPAGKKRDGETEGRRDGTAYGGGRAGRCKGRGGMSEQDDTNMTFDYMGCLERRSAMDHLRTPRCFHTATPQPQHADQNNMAERRDPRP